MNLGKGIKVARTSLGLTQDDIHTRAGIAQGYYSLLENGHNRPSLNTLQKICEALEIPMIILFWLGSEKRDFKSKAQYDKFKDALDGLVQKELETLYGVK